MSASLFGRIACQCITESFTRGSEKEEQYLIRKNLKPDQCEVVIVKVDEQSKLYEGITNKLY